MKLRNLDLSSDVVIVNEPLEMRKFVCANCPSRQIVLVYFRSTDFKERLPCRGCGIHYIWDWRKECFLEDNIVSSVTPIFELIDL